VVQGGGTGGGGGVIDVVPVFMPLIC